MSGELIKALISLAFAAFFSGVETAFISSDKMHIALQKQKADIISHILSKFFNRPSRFLTTVLIGNTLALVVYGMAVASLLSGPIEQYLSPFFSSSTEVGNSSLRLTSLFAQTIMATLLVLAIAEFLPKSITLSNPYGFLRLMAFPMNLLYHLLLPAAWCIDKLASFTITKGFRMKYQPNKPLLLGLQDISNYLQQSKKTPSSTAPAEEEILSNVLDMKTTRVRECMTPRTEIMAVSHDISMPALREAFVGSGHTKLLVYEGTVDNIIGYCHMMGMMKKPQRMEDVMSPIIAVPETFLASNLMVRFINERKSIAVILDEFGGTSGIVTMEDLIEVIFGNIEDEFDKPEWVFEQIDEKTFQLSARHEIDFLNNQYGWDLPESDSYGTLGGYVLHLYESFPKAGDIVKGENCTIQVLSIQEARINLVRIQFN